MTRGRYPGPHKILPMQRALPLVLGLTLASAAQAQVSVGEKAPTIAFDESLSKQAPSFQALRGKVLMLDFFATW